MRTIQKPHLAHLPHWVYRLFDKSGTLLYVGLSSDPDRRFEHHMLCRDWLAEIDHHTVTPYPNWEQGAAAEQKAIETERPKYNRHFVPTIVCPKCGGQKDHGPPYCKACRREYDRAYRRKRAGLPPLPV